MLYGLGVIAATGKVSKLVDRTKSTELILFLGAIISGLGLIAVGLMGSRWLGNGAVSTVMGIAAVFMVGIAHGFINAPVVTHVSQSNLAKRVGVNTAATSYRFLERGGHVLGPVIVSQMFLMWGQGAHIIGWIGGAITILGLLFVARHLIPKPAQLRAEPAE
jgi:ABC-type transport system involved in multi-copper enzyme maturation permease subunit